MPKRLRVEQTVKLTRVSSKYLRVSGAFCMLQQPWESEPCGGSLAVEDSGRSGPWRYELFCQKCKTCDPNGHGTRVEVMRAAKTYFAAAVVAERQRLDSIAKE